MVIKAPLLIEQRFGLIPQSFSGFHSTPTAALFLQDKTAPPQAANMQFIDCHVGTRTSDQSAPVALAAEQISSRVVKWDYAV